LCLQIFRSIDFDSFLLDYECVGVESNRMHRLLRNFNSVFVRMLSYFYYLLCRFCNGNIVRCVSTLLATYLLRNSLLTASSLADLIICVLALVILMNISCLFAQVTIGDHRNSFMSVSSLTNLSLHAHISIGAFLVNMVAFQTYTGYF